MDSPVTEAGYVPIHCLAVNLCTFPVVLHPTQLADERQGLLHSTSPLLTGATLVVLPMRRSIQKTASAKECSSSVVRQLLPSEFDGGPARVRDH
jgi:hypothetical protein